MPGYEWDDEGTLKNKLGAKSVDELNKLEAPYVADRILQIELGYPVLPAALVGRLAVDQRAHGKGLGSVLLADAALRVLKGDAKAFALIVEAKNEKAVAFYKHQCFHAFASLAHLLFLPLATLKKAAAT